MSAPTTLLEWILFMIVTCSIGGLIGVLTYAIVDKVQRQRARGRQVHAHHIIHLFEPDSAIRHEHERKRRR